MTTSSAAAANAASSSASPKPMPLQTRILRTEKFDATMMDGQLHCDVCRTDITCQYRIRCRECNEFDLCLSCFASGAELHGHLSSHAYSVVEYIRQPIYVQQMQQTEQQHHVWGADEELHLLQLIEHCGYGNWNEIAEQLAIPTSTVHMSQSNAIGSQHMSNADKHAQASKDEVEKHYRSIYLENNVRPQYPDEDKFISHLSKSKQQQTTQQLINEQHNQDAHAASINKQNATPHASGEQKLFAEATGTDEPPSVEPTLHVKTEGNAAAVDVSVDGMTDSVDADKSLTARSKAKNTKQTNSRNRQSGANAAAARQGANAQTAASTAATAEKPLNPKPKASAALANLVGYLPQRQDFDTEYENDAELIIADMEFRDKDDSTGEPADAPWERDLKLKVLAIYNTKLDARQERKNFIIQRGLLEKRERKRGKEEREIYNNMRCFARFFETGEKFEEFIQGLLNESRLRRRIEQLQQYRMLGIKSLAEADKFEDLRKRNIDPEKAQAQAKAAQLQQQQQQSAKKRPIDEVVSATNASSFGDAMSVKIDPPADPSASMSDSATVDASSSLGSKRPKLSPKFNLSELEGYELLAPKERQLCETIQLIPTHYFAIKEKLIRECFQRGYLREGQAKQLIKIDINKTTKIMDFFVSAGWINTESLIQAAIQRKDEEKQQRDKQQADQANSINADSKVEPDGDVTILSANNAAGKASASVAASSTDMQIDSNAS